MIEVKVMSGFNKEKLFSVPDMIRKHLILIQLQLDWYLRKKARWLNQRLLMMPVQSKIRKYLKVTLYKSILKMYMILLRSPHLFELSYFINSPIKFHRNLHFPSLRLTKVKSYHELIKFVCTTPQLFNHVPGCFMRCYLQVEK